MANRFIRLIEDGTIASEGELKSAFRAHALATHPDLGAAGAAGAAGVRGDDFIKARAEYEAALRYLEPGNGERGVSATAFGKQRDRFDRALFYADLAALLKAGFPKTARHDQERRKYARLRLHVRSSLAARDGDTQDSPLARFDRFERVLALLKASPEPGHAARFGSVVDLLDDLIAYEVCGIVPLRASIEIEFAGLRAATNDEGLLGFLAFLTGDMDGGTTIL